MNRVVISAPKWLPYAGEGAHLCVASAPACSNSCMAAAANSARPGCAAMTTAACSGGEPSTATSVEASAPSSNRTASSCPAACDQRHAILITHSTPEDTSSLWYLSTSNSGYRMLEVTTVHSTVSTAHHERERGATACSCRHPCHRRSAHAPQSVALAAATHKSGW